jgi:hypothetical protein
MAMISKEELNEINVLKSKLANVVSDSGQFVLQMQILEMDIKELKEKLEQQGTLFKTLLQEEQGLVKRLSEKYGVGSINFDTGEFTPEK